MRKKHQSTLDRLIRNMGKHMARHPRDAATLAHAQKLGILADVQDEAKRLREQEAVELVHGRRRDPLALAMGGN